MSLILLLWTNISLIIFQGNSTITLLDLKPWQRITTFWEPAVRNTPTNFTPCWFVISILSSDIAAIQVKKRNKFKLNSNNKKKKNAYDHGALEKCKNFWKKLLNWQLEFQFRQLSVQLSNKRAVKKARTHRNHPFSTTRLTFFLSAVKGAEKNKRESNLSKTC